MADKTSIILKKNNDNKAEDINIFELSIGYVQYNFHDFNKDGYFVNLLNNLKRDDDDVCYIVTSFLVDSGHPKNFINNVLDIASEKICISSVPIKKFLFIEKAGEEVHLLIFRKDNIQNVKKLIETLEFSDSDARCYIVFDKESDKEKMISLCKNIPFFGKEFFTKLSEGIRIEFNCCCSEYVISFFSRHFDISYFKNKILNSIDKEKFEVGVL
jgi:hypothetical protein